MKLFPKTLIFALAVATASTSFAREGFYLQGDLSASAFNDVTRFDDAYVSDPSTGGSAAFTNSIKKKAMGAGISAGYLFEVADKLYVGPEIGFHYLGSIKRTAHLDVDTAIQGFTGEVDASLKQNLFALDFLAVIAYELDESFEVFAKAGFASMVMQQTAAVEIGTGIDGKLRNDQSDVLFELAGGVGYNFNQNWQLNTTVTHYFGKKQTTDELFKEIPSITAFSLGLRYTF